MPEAFAEATAPPNPGQTPSVRPAWDETGGGGPGGAQQAGFMGGGVAGGTQQPGFGKIGAAGCWGERWKIPENTAGGAATPIPGAAAAT